MFEGPPPAPTPQDTQGMRDNKADKDRVAIVIPFQEPAKNDSIVMWPGLEGGGPTPESVELLNHLEEMLDNLYSDLLPNAEYIVSDKFPGREVNLVDMGNKTKFEITIPFNPASTVGDAKVKLQGEGLPIVVEYQIKEQNFEMKFKITPIKKHELKQHVDGFDTALDGSQEYRIDIIFSDVGSVSGQRKVTFTTIPNTKNSKADNSELYRHIDVLPDSDIATVNELMSLPITDRFFKLLGDVRSVLAREGK